MPPMTPVEIAAVAAACVGFVAVLALAACMLASRVDQDTDAARAAQDEQRRQTAISALDAYAGVMRGEPREAEFSMLFRSLMAQNKEDREDSARAKAAAEAMHDAAEDEVT